MLPTHRPTNLSEFVARLQGPSTESAEQEALRAWGTTAVDSCLTTAYIPQLPWEAARLAEVLDPHPWVKLLRNLVNAIIQGSADGTSLAPSLLRSLACMIRQREDWSSESTEIVESLFSGLKARLEQADKLGAVERKYELTCVLGVVIDAMVDIGVSNISHEHLYKPLISLLDGCSKDTELHLA